MCSDYHGFIMNKSDDLIFVFGSKNTAVGGVKIIQSKADIDEFAKTIENSINGGFCVSDWFDRHNAVRHDCYMESDLRPSHLAAFVLFIDKL